MVTNYNFDLAESGFNYLYHNNGDLTFTDVTAQAGIHQEDEPTFIGMWSDYDNDMEPDLFLLNDRSTWRNFLYRNSGDGNFVKDVIISIFSRGHCLLVGVVAIKQTKKLTSIIKNILSYFEINSYTFILNYFICSFVCVDS